MERTTVVICKACKSKNTELKNVRYEHQEIGWSDGLGSPGTITHKIEMYLCKDCLDVFELIGK